MPSFREPVGRPSVQMEPRKSAPINVKVGSSKPTSGKTVSLSFPEETNHRVTENTEKNTEKNQKEKIKGFLFFPFSTFSVFSVTLWLVFDAVQMLGAA